MEARYLLWIDTTFQSQQGAKPRNKLSQDYLDVMHEEGRNFHNADSTTLHGQRGRYEVLRRYLVLIYTFPSTICTSIG